MSSRHYILSAAAFNDLYPEGSLFRYYPVSGEDEYVEGKSRSVAWELGHGAPVVLIEGKTGGVCIEHLRHVPS